MTNQSQNNLFKNEFIKISKSLNFGSNLEFILDPISVDYVVIESEKLALA